MSKVDQVNPKIPRNVWVLGFVSLFTDLGTKMIQSVLPVFLVSVLGANVVTIGLIEGVAESTASILKIFSGTLSDYWGRRKELAIAGYGFSALIIPLFALASSPMWVFFARFLDRVGKGIRVAPRNALIADATGGKKSGAAYGLRQTLDTIGAFSGPLVATAIMFSSGENFRLVFWVAIVPCFISVLLLIKGIKEPKTKKPSKKFKWSVYSQLNKSYWLLLAVFVLFNLGNSSDAFLLLQAQQIGISDSLIPLSLVVMNLSYCLSAYPLGVLSDKIGKVGLLLTSFFLFSLTYLGFAFAQNSWQIWGLFVLYGLYLGMSQGIFLALIAQKVPDDLRGTAFGIVSFAKGVVLLPASLLAGLLWDKINPQATFITGSCLAIVAGFIFMFTFKKDGNAYKNH